MKRSTVAWAIGGMGCLLVLMMGAGALFLLSMPDESGFASSPLAMGGRVGIADLEGVIFSADRVRETLERFRKSSSVKAVVLRINSPGGGVAASQEIHRELQRFRAETKKPLVVSMESVAASGGYYAAVAADRIIANPGTITGSIGVIIQWVNYGDLLEWAKLRPVTLKSGALKDAGNPARPMTPEEQAYFQAIIDRLRGQFNAAVAEGRKGRLKPGALETMADGRVVTGDEAVEMGLVDELGDYADAVNAAAKLVGLRTPPEVWHPKPPKAGLLTLLFGPAENTLAGRLLSSAPVGGGWNVYFLW